MNNNITTTAESGNTPQEEKNFTQDQLNAIVSTRLAKERAKLEAELEDREKGRVKLEEEMTLREQELVRREFQIKAKETLTARGYPVSILEALNATDEASLDKLPQHIIGHACRRNSKG